MLFAILVRRLRRLRSWRRHRYGGAGSVDLNSVTTRTGDVLTLLEPDYQYGVGPLRLRVESVDRAHPMAYEGEDWYPVAGVQLSAEGAALGRREVLVRGSRLRG